MIKRFSDSDTTRFWAEAIVACLFAAAIGIVVGLLTSPVDPVYFAKTAELFPPVFQKLLLPEPQERNAVLYSVLSLPLCWLASVWLFNRVRPPEKTIRLIMPLLVLLVFIEILFGAIFRTYLMNTQPFGVVAMAVGCALIWFAGNFRRSWQRVPSYLLWTLAALPAVLQIWSARIYMPEYIYLFFCGHFSLIVQTIVNNCNGFFSPSQYGCYAVFLLPWFAIFGHSIISICAVMGVLFFGSMVVLLFLWSKLLRNRLLILVGACVLTLWTGNYTLLRLGDFDPYFQYYPIRSLGPILSALFVYLMILHGHKQSWLPIVGALLATAGVFWNLDSGIICVLALVIWFGWNAICRPNRENVRNLLVFIILCVAGIAAVLLAVGSAEFEKLLKYQKIFFLSGFNMLPLPLKLHLWPIVLGSYFVLWGWSAKMIWRIPKNRHWQMLFFMSTVGLGLFFYYQGRSYDGSLITVSWPLLWSMVVLFDRCILPSTKTAKYNYLRIVPVIVLGILLGSYLADIPATLRLCRLSTARFADRKPEFYRDFEFIRENAPPDKIANITGPGQGFYSAQTGIIPSFEPCNQMEFILKKDFDDFLQQLMLTRRPIFVITRKFVFDWAPPEDFFNQFTLKATSPSGQIRYYIPILPPEK